MTYTLNILNSNISTTAPMGRLMDFIYTWRHKKEVTTYADAG